MFVQPPPAAARGEHNADVLATSSLCRPALRHHQAEISPAGLRRLTGQRHAKSVRAVFEIGGWTRVAARAEQEFEKPKPRKEWDFWERKWVYEEERPDERDEQRERLEKERAELDAAKAAERQRREAELAELGRLKEELDVYVVDDMPRRIFSRDEDSEAMLSTKRFMERMEEEAKRAEAMPPARYPIVGGPSSRQRRINAKKAKQQERYEARFKKAVVSAEEAAQTEEERAALREQALREYAAIKLELLRNCLLLGLGGTALTFLATGDQHSTASFAVGAAGSLFYLVLLARGVDRGPSGGGGAVGYAVPVLLALFAKKYDFLDFLPSLLGFFTYKAAVLIYTFKEAFGSGSDAE